MKIKRKIGLIGVGNMGAAILEGLFQKGMASPHQVWVHDQFKTKVSNFSKKWGVHTSRSIQELVKAVDVVLLAIKPQDIETAGRELKEAAHPRMLISILAGTPISKIKRYAGRHFDYVRAMPNLGAKVGESLTAITGSNAMALRFAEKIFLGCGKVVRLNERHFDLVTALSGSGPAYFFF